MPMNPLLNPKKYPYACPKTCYFNKDKPSPSEVPLPTPRCMTSHMAKKPLLATFQISALPDTPISS